MEWLSTVKLIIIKHGTNLKKLLCFAGSITDKVGNQESNNNLNMYYMMSKLDKYEQITVTYVNCAV